MLQTKAAQAVLEEVCRRADAGGHTGIRLTHGEIHTIIARTLHCSFSKWSADQMTRFRHMLGGHLLRAPSASGPWLFKTYGNDIDIVADEQLVLAAFSSTALNMRFMDVSPDVLQRDGDVEILADEVLYHLANNEDISIITASETDTTWRRSMVQQAIMRRCAGSGGVTLPPFMSIHRTLAQFRPGSGFQKSVLIVDNAHLFGSIEWAKLVRMASKTTVLVGCSFLEGPKPGITLRRLFPMSAGAYAFAPSLESKAWLSDYLTGTLLRQVHVLLRYVVTLAQLRFKDITDVVVISTSDTVTRQGNRSPVRLTYMPFRAMMHTPITARTTLVGIDASVLRHFTTGDWCLFLCHLRRSCLLIKFDGAFPDPDLVYLIMTAPTAPPRQLAQDLLITTPTPTAAARNTMN